MVAALFSVVFLSSSGARQAPTDACPMHLVMDAQARVYENRMKGNYRVSRQTLISDLQGGCKEWGPVSSITLRASPKTRVGPVTEIIELIHLHAPHVPFTLLDGKADTSRP